MQKNKKPSLWKRMKNRFINHLEELKKTDKEAGATFIEIIVTIAIIIILMGSVGLAVVSNITKAQIASARSQLGTFQNAVELYYLSEFKYPKADEWEQAIIPYINGNVVPVDPWGNKYEYIEKPADGFEFGIRSLGADGSEGGEENDADINSWEKP